MANQIDSSIERLTQLADSDGVFYVLALHSFVEARLRAEISEVGTIADFVQLLQASADLLKKRGARADWLTVLSRMAQEHVLVEELRRGFRVLDPEEVVAATHNFLSFCRLQGIDSPALKGLRQKLHAWRTHRAREERETELSRVQAEILAAQPNARALLTLTEQWTRDRNRLAEVDGEIERVSSQMARLRQAGGAAPDRPPPERLPELDRHLGRLRELRAPLVERLEGYHDLDRYVEHVRRFSLYTRTRMDYERTLLELTAEQQQAVDEIRGGSDFLIRGGAGTGKTIVLLHALKRLRQDASGELALTGRGRILLLTYTNTLVKYDRYVAEILRERETGDLILTADGFLQSRMGLLATRSRIDYGLIPRLAQRLNTTTFFSPAELAVEIEELIFGALITRQEYVEARIPRRGMRQPLSAGQREAVWQIRDRMVEEMEQDGIYSKNYSRRKLVEHLEAHPEDRRFRDIDVAFVDESQDLSAADLRALRLMSARGLIMAGDSGQSIYGVSSPYKRAGIDITGRSRILRESFRNTVPIQELADAYRRRGEGEEEGAGAVAFRDGPIPELYLAGTRDELARLLVRKASLFVDRLGYDPENLTVLAPTRTDIATIGDLLGHAGYRHADIRDDDFSFRETGTIRLSTLHSSKGLDFPVVLLYLPGLPSRGELDDRSSGILNRNLIYVAMTRAMDNLNVFMLEGAREGQSDAPLEDLVAVFRDYQRRHT